MFKVISKSKFVIATFATIQEANALKQRMNAMTSNRGGGWRKSDERYSVVEVA